MTGFRHHIGRAGATLPGTAGRGERGAVSIEFAFVLAPFLILAMGIIDVGFMLLADGALQQATEDAARLIRTGQVTSRDGTIKMNSQDFISALCEKATVIPNCEDSLSLDVSSSTDFSHLSTGMPDPVSVGPDHPGGSPEVHFQPGGAGKPTVVIATYDWNFTLPLMNAFGNIDSSSTRRLESVIVVRNEPF